MAAKEEAIRVCIRQRPLFEKEINAGHNKAWNLEESGSLTLVAEPTDPAHKNLKRAYAFDVCFDETSTNGNVYEKTAKDIVTDVVKGINGCYMAYGQTGCGKTHSIMGNASDPGMLPRSLAELFDMIAEGGTGEANSADDEATIEFLMRVTYVEIYLERVNDLLNDQPGADNLDVKEDKSKGFFVVGLSEITVTTLRKRDILPAQISTKLAVDRIPCSALSWRALGPILMEGVCRRRES